MVITTSEIEEKIKKEVISIAKGSLVEKIEKIEFLHKPNNSWGIAYVDKGLGYYAARLFNYNHGYENSKISEIFGHEAAIPHYGLFTHNKTKKIFEAVEMAFRNVKEEGEKKNELNEEMKRLCSLIDGDQAFSYHSVKENYLYDNFKKWLEEKNTALARIGELENLLGEAERQRDARPNITIETYNQLLNNQKPDDYDSIKNELDKWKNGLGGKTLEQVQAELNKISVDNEVSEKEGATKKAIQDDNNSEETNKKSNLETYRKKWIQKIKDALADKGNESDEWYLELKSSKLTKSEYINFDEELQKKESKEEIEKFGEEVMGDITEQRKRHLNITKTLKQGEEAVKNQNVELAQEVLNNLNSLQESVKEEEKLIFYSKITRIHKLKSDIGSLTKTQQVQEAKIIQNTF